MKIRTINDKELDKILESTKSDRYVYDKDRVYIDGLLYIRESIATEQSTRTNARSLIDKEPYFDYSFMDCVYQLIGNNINDMNAIHCTRPMHKGRRTHQYRFEIDLYSAYPHVLKYARLPIDGKLYEEETKGKMNFYLYKGDFLKHDSIIVDELKEYIEENNLGECQFLFATDYREGSKMGDWLHQKAFYSQKSKAEIKKIHYGYYQKRYLKYDWDEDCYIRNPKHCHELLMVAILSHLALLMIKIRDEIGDMDGMVVTDAYHWDSDRDLCNLYNMMKKEYPQYNFRIYDYEKQKDPIFKSYIDPPAKGVGKKRGNYRNYDMLKIDNIQTEKNMR